MAREKFRTDIENLLLNEMVEEDANYLIMGDDDDNVEAVVSNYSGAGMFNSSSEDSMIDDVDIDDSDNNTNDEDPYDIFQEVNNMNDFYYDDDDDF